MKQYEHDYGQWKYVFKVNGTYLYGLQLAYRYDDNYNFIVIEKYDYKNGKLIHRYYSNVYSKKNLLEAREFYTLLLRSYRSNLPSTWTQ